MHSPMLAPVVALVGWTMVMWAWMYATRIPAIRAMRMKLDPQALRGEQMATLPARVRWKADNHNHLMEQPTIFYPLALVLAFVRPGDDVALVLAWSYVGLRVVHSVVQAAWNKIEVRFVLFFLSSLALIGMILLAARAVF
jgi:hypothetical protein